MGKCTYCGDDVLLPFTCTFCGGQFCNTHRLPENHQCPNEPPRTPLGRWQAKIAPITNKLIEGESVSDGEFESKSSHHFVRKRRENQYTSLSHSTRGRSKISRIKKVAIGLGVVISILAIGVVLFYFVIRPKIWPFT